MRLVEAAHACLAIKVYHERLVGSVCVGQHLNLDPTGGACRETKSNWCGFSLVWWIIEHAHSGHNRTQTCTTARDIPESGSRSTCPRKARSSEQCQWDARQCVLFTECHREAHSAEPCQWNTHKSAPLREIMSLRGAFIWTMSLRL